MKTKKTTSTLQNEGANEMEIQKINVINGSSKNFQIPDNDDSEGYEFQFFLFVHAEWEPIVKKWVDYKKSKNKPYRGFLSLQSMYEELKWISYDNPKIGLEIIENAISNNYSDFDEPNDNCITDMSDIENSIGSLKRSGVVTERKAELFVFGTYDECNESFEYCFNRLDNTVENFKYLHEYDDFVDWMTYTYGKGLILMGDCGRGKSTILLSVIPVLFYQKYEKIICPISATELNTPSHIYGNTKGWAEVSKQWCIAIDDLGKEDAETIDGKSYEPFNKIIDEAEKYHKLVFISTSLTLDELKQRYGEHCYFKLLRLCRRIEFNGYSLRPLS